MPRLRTGLTRLLACLLLLQWAAALLPHARAVAQLASAQAVEICTHDGRRIALLGDDGSPVQPAQAMDCCSLCHSPLGIAPPEPPQVAQPVAYNAVAAPFRAAGLPVHPPRAPPQQPRAPPRT
ncbi:DUF2946 family protein [Roseomonas sp. BN140053]|uniref:DUF2946 family protein n=1 Tax=Roseomonas sp. BN140053 TaxID=3391898 RepID=UPI0039EBAF9F